MKQLIICPECGSIELATIDTTTVPFYTYIHFCKKCEYIIMESDWEPLKAISIKQPWAWLIVNGYKDLENRSTLKNFRGTVLICASKQWDKNWHQFNLWNDSKFDELFSEVGTSYAFDELDTGGIIGAVTITDSITKSDSPWFIGPNAFVLTNPVKLPFTPCKGFLGFFNPKIHKI